MEKKEWIDEPNKPGWWFCLQNEKSDHSPGKLIVVYAYYERGYR